MKHVFALLLVALTLYLRLGNLDGHLTYEWDQERDMAAVTKMLETDEPALLGPIVRGNIGGFYLGPWYYYLLAPLIAWQGASPLTLAYSSTGADVLVVLVLYYLISRRLNRTTALTIVTIWACSPLIIRGSYTPWNVSLIPLWSLAFIWAWGRSPALLTLLATLTTSIHLTLWPLAVVGLLANWRLFVGRTLKEYIRIFLAAFLPLTPVIIHDLTHRFENFHLFKFFMRQGSHGGLSYLDSLANVTDKFGYTIGRLLTGEPTTWLGLTVAGALLAYAIFHAATNTVIRASLILTITLLASLVYYREYAFAEYYFLAAFLPLFLVAGYALHRIPRLPLLFIILAIYLPLGVKTAKQPSYPFAYGSKQKVTEALHTLPYPVAVRYSLPEHKKIGLEYLVATQELSDQTAPQKAYVYESENLELIAPDDARSIIHEQSLGVYKLVVFSN